MPNGDDEQIDGSDTEPSGWLITVSDDMGWFMIGFTDESQARTAFEALKPAFVLGESGKLKLEYRDENENWIRMDEADLL